MFTNLNGKEDKFHANSRKCPAVLDLLHAYTRVRTDHDEEQYYIACGPMNNAADWEACERNAHLMPIDDERSKWKIDKTRVCREGERRGFELETSLARKHDGGEENLNPVRSSRAHAAGQTCEPRRLHQVRV